MISSRRNRKLKDIRSLQRSKGARALLEGTHLVLEAVESSVELEYVLVTPELDRSEEGDRLRTRLSDPPRLVREDLLSSVTDADSPRGVVAVARLPRLRAEDLPLEPRGLYVYLDGVQDPGNLGAIARVAEAFGAIALACRSGCAHPNHPRSLRGSAGSLLRLPTAFPCEPGSLQAHLGRIEARWMALDAHAGVELGGGADDLSPPLVLALGSEGRGLSREVEDRAGLRLRIPVREPVESLNVATAAAVVLWEASRRP